MVNRVKQNIGRQDDKCSAVNTQWWPFVSRCNKRRDEHGDHHRDRRGNEWPGSWKPRENQ